MTSENTSNSGQSAFVLAIISCLAALILLLGMTFAPAASWLGIVYAVMAAAALMAGFFGMRQWSAPRAKRATILAVFVLLLAVFLLFWGSFSAEISQPT